MEKMYLNSMNIMTEAPRICHSLMFPVIYLKTNCVISVPHSIRINTLYRDVNWGAAETLTRWWRDSTSGRCLLHINVWFRRRMLQIETDAKNYVHNRRPWHDPDPKICRLLWLSEPYQPQKKTRRYPAQAGRRKTYEHLPLAVTARPNHINLIRLSGDRMPSIRKGNCV